VINDVPYEIEWAPTVIRRVSQLPEKVATAVVEFVYGALVEAPHRVGHPIRFEFEGKHSANRGDCRVVYKIDDEFRVITVLVVDHRSKIYRTG